MRLRIELEPVKPFVALTHLRFHALTDLVAAMDRIIETGGYDGVPVDYLDGVVFSADESYLCLGVQTATPGPVSDYTGQQIYYRSIQHADGAEKHDRLTIHDYLWRWDTDWFWCSRAFGAQNPIDPAVLAAALPAQQLLLEADAARPAVRHRRPPREAQRPPAARAGGPGRRGADRAVPPSSSTGSWRTCRSSRSGCARCGCATTTAGRCTRSGRATPTSTSASGRRCPVGATEGETNRLIERKVSELDGHKSLYSDAYYSREEFDELYGGETYQTVKKQLRPRFTTARPLCEGGATAMTTFKERRRMRDGPASRDAGRRGRVDKLTLAEILEIFAGGRLPLRFTAYDGSSAGPADAPLGLDLKTPRGTTYLATAPGDLGLARAYVAGDLDIHGVHPGDPYELLKALADEPGLQAAAGAGAGPHRPLHRLRAPAPDRAAAAGGAAALAPRRRRACGTARPATPRRSTTTTTSRTRSTSGCSGRR